MLVSEYLRSTSERSWCYMQHKSVLYVDGRCKKLMSYEKSLSYCKACILTTWIHDLSDSACDIFSIIILL